MPKKPTGESRWLPLLPPEDPATLPRDYTVRTTVWRYPGAGGWHFATLPPALSGTIKARFGAAARGWGSIPVRVAIGATEWETSLFPDRKRGGYLFAIKAAVRKAERLADGDAIDARIHVR